MTMTTAISYKPYRSALYLPASNLRAINKARTIDADAIIFDLEDAVAPQAKAVARENLIQGFAEGSFGKSHRVIRINQIDTPYFADDLAMLERCAADAILIPKVSSGENAAVIAGRIRALSLPAVPRIWAMIETPEALLNLTEIAIAGQADDPPLECFVVGTNDIAKETGVSADDGRACLLPWLMNIVLVARRYGLRVLDGVWNDFRDMHGYEREVRQSRMMGFDGKTLIHPTQVDLANQEFAPSKEAVAEARAIVEAFARPENAGAGVISIDGKMVELLHLEMAKRVLSIDAAIRA